MTDRIKSLTVILDKDYREDDIEVLEQAISQLRGVLKVVKTPLNTFTSEDSINRERIKFELKEKLFEILE